MMKKIIDMRQALENPAILGSAIRPAASNWLGQKKADTFLAWRALLIAALGEKLNREERRAFEALTKRTQEPGQVVEEFVAIVGRRGGKTLAGAVLLVYLACLIDYSDILNVGERGVALFIAQNQKTATVAFNYAAGIINASPLLKSMVVNQTADTIELNNGVTLEVRPASFRGLRGVTAVAVLADEAAFWYTEGSANSDEEILAAVRPSLATTGGMLVVFSSPYGKKGELWEYHEKHYKPDGDASILVAKGTSRDLNPSLSQKVVDRALERDPVKASSEYLAQFRQNETGFLSRDLIMEAVDSGVTSRPPIAGIQYVAFADAASGIAASGDGDRFAMAVGHLEGDVALIDHAQIWKPPFSASAITGECAAIARAYGVSEIVSDGYSAGFFRSELSRHSMGHRISEFNKSECYLATLPAFTSRKLKLLDQPFIVDEFAALERKVGSAGTDRVDAKGHEDGSNCVSGVTAMLLAAKPLPGAGLLEFYRREAEAAKAEQSLPPTVAKEHADAGIMQIGVKPPDGYVWVNIPGEVSHIYGRFGRAYVTSVDGEGRRTAIMSIDDAREFISSPLNLQAFELNAELRHRIGNTLSQPRGIRVVDMLQQIEDQQPLHPFDKAGIAAQSLAMLRQAR